MSTKKPRDPNKPLTVADAASRICALIAQAPDEAAVAARIRAAIAEERAGLQQKIDALAARVTEPEKLGKVILAMTDDLCGFRVTMAENDAAVEEAGEENDLADAVFAADTNEELPRGAREYPKERAAIAERGRR